MALAKRLRRACRREGSSARILGNRDDMELRSNTLDSPARARIIPTQLLSKAPRSKSSSSASYSPPPSLEICSSSSTT
jgi:hypothetical protein